MHPEAFAGFGWALSQVDIDPDHEWRVLDFGGQNVNGSAHSWLPKSKITTLDLYKADIIADASKWEPTRLFDIVMATELFEHTPKWRDIIHTMRVSLDPKGPGVLLTTCASHGRQPHGSSGGPRPINGEWYQNVDPKDLIKTLKMHFSEQEAVYLYPPGDVYAWAVA